MKATIKETLKKTLAAHPQLKRNIVYHELSPYETGCIHGQIRLEVAIPTWCRR